MKRPQREISLAVKALVICVSDDYRVPRVITAGVCKWLSVTRPGKPGDVKLFEIGDLFRRPAINRLCPDIRNVVCIGGVEDCFSVVRPVDLRYDGCGRFKIESLDQFPAVERHDANPVWGG